MGFWSKLGKIGLAAAPYIAAPFTGGASMSLAPMTNKALGAWNQHDANVAASKGLAPSSFDKVVGIGSSLAGAAAQSGAFGNENPNLTGWQGKLQNFGDYMGGARPGARIPPVGSRGQMGPSAWQGALGGAINSALDAYGNSGRNSGESNDPSRSPSSGTGQAVPRGGVMPRRGFSYNENPLNQYDQTTPNLSEALHQGRTEAIRNQPFRSGYDTKTQVGDQVFTSRTPAITPNDRRRKSKTTQEMEMSQ